jgi:hypothetical protein
MLDACARMFAETALGARRVHQGDVLQELRKRMPESALRRLLGGVENITLVSINPE